MLRPYTFELIIKRYKEHKDKRIIKQLLEKFNINKLNIEKAKINTNNGLSIILDNVTYKITYEDDYYRIEKQYKDYTICDLYDEIPELFRREILYNLPNNKYLLIDKTNDDNEIISTRFSITSEKYQYDLDEFEYSILYTKQYDSKERFLYYNTPTKKYLHKSIQFPNFIIYSHKEEYISPAELLSGSIEINAKTKPFYSDLFSRIEDYTEGFNDTIKLIPANMTILGNELDEKTKNNHFFKINIIKKDNLLSLKIVILDDKNNTILNENIKILTDTYNEITIDDINKIINNINNKINYKFKNIIIVELNRLIDEIKDQKNHMISNPNLFDYKLIEQEDFIHIAFDIYCNLDKYIDYIDKLYNNHKKILLQKK